MKLSLIVVVQAALCGVANAFLPSSKPSTSNMQLAVGNFESFYDEIGFQPLMGAKLNYGTAVSPEFVSAPASEGGAEPSQKIQEHSEEPPVASMVGVAALMGASLNYGTAVAPELITAMEPKAVPKDVVAPSGTITADVVQGYADEAPVAGMVGSSALMNAKLNYGTAMVPSES